MSVLKKFSDRKPTKADEKKDRIEKTFVADQMADQRKILSVPICDGCGQSEFWEQHHGDEVMCCVCSPPSLAGLVDREYFWDADGNEWDVTRIGDGERCTRC